MNDQDPHFESLELLLLKFMAQQHARQKVDIDSLAMASDIEAGPPPYATGLIPS